jgi:hypothetical protein
VRTVPAALQAHLDGGTTTMCYCWRVTRRDGLVQGFTEHDEDLVFDGTSFAASAGFSATEVQQTLGLSVDNLTVQGALSSDAISEADLAAGRYDDAEVELFWVNWADPTQRITVLVGTTGEAKRQGVAFSAELRGLTARLDQTTMRLFQRTCDARLGARCASGSLRCRGENGFASRSVRPRGRCSCSRSSGSGCGSPCEMGSGSGGRALVVAHLALG